MEKVEKVEKVKRKMIKFPSIEQFRNIVKNVREHSTFVGKDEDGNPIFDYTKPAPTLTFSGTVKLHGTNAGVSLDVDSGLIWAQSRENIITPQNDNAGFAFFVETNIDSFKRIFDIVKSQNNITNGYITVFGEWAGKGIQKGVGICNIEKSFFIFDIKHSTKVQENEDTKVQWLPIPIVKGINPRIWDIEEFTTWTIDIDFNRPEEAQNKLIELTDKVEQECPVAMEFGFSGIGEGIVWKTKFENDVIRFKVKGEKHSSSKVKKLANVDIEKVNSINEFVEYAVTENRLNQGIEQVFTATNRIPDIKLTGDFIKWISCDVMKEELDTIAANGLEWKEVAGAVNKKASSFFKTFLDKQIFKV